MSHATDRDTTQYQRYGRCHRCGWSQPLARVRGRRNFAAMKQATGGVTLGCRWLCEECLVALRADEPFRPQPVAATIVDHRTKRSTKIRSVA
jgi:hypothetical protein